MDPLYMARIFVCAFFAILFIQSGFDKLFDWKGNLGWLTPHFANSPFKNMVPVMVAMMTLFEVGTGLVSAAAVVFLIVRGDPIVPVAAMTLACTSLLMLFFGQRFAKDYAGAATISSYFAVALIGTYLMIGIK